MRVQSDIQRYTEIYRHTHTQTGKQRGTHRDIATHRRYRHTEMQTYSHRGVDIQKDRQADIQISRHTVNILLPIN